jgi:abortive infection bacteriophage resistance protein
MITFDEDIERIPYEKSPISIKEQVQKLKSRGLVIDDEELAAKYLSNISYYRLRAYTYPFQNNVDPDKHHEFIRKDIHFKDIIDLYCFDRRLRILVFNALEKIEVALRAKITQRYSEATNDSHWYQDESLFKDDAYMKDGLRVFKYNTLMEDIEDEVDRSDEEFIKHYYRRYSEPDMPPSWMALEVVSFGSLSRLYDLLVKDDQKKAVAKELGLNKVDILENWMHALSNLRNCCAHHSRIWNRRFIVNMLLPTNADYPFLDRNTIATTKRNKLFAYLCCIKYILDIVSPDNNFYANLQGLIAQGGSLLSLKDMGFPDNWRGLGIWKL